jgi:hypothetical protein
MNFPDEILNLIFSFRGSHPLAIIIKSEINKYLISKDHIKFKDWILKKYYYRCKYNLRNKIKNLNLRNIFMINYERIQQEIREEDERPFDARRYN